MNDSESVCGAVTLMVDAVNRGDFATVVSCFHAEPVIVEDLPPFRWNGPSAVADWLEAMGANGAKLQASSIQMVLGDAKQLELEAGRCYACFGGTLRVETTEGKLRAEGMLTFVLRYVGDRWLIDTLVWSGPRPA